MTFRQQLGFTVEGTPVYGDIRLHGRQRISPLIVIGASLLANYIGSKLNKPGKQTNTSQSTSTTSAGFSPEVASLVSGLIRQKQSEMSRGSSLPQGYSTNAVEGINSAFTGAKTALNADLTARGLGTSPAATGSLQQLEQARGGQIGDLLSTKIPLLERQFKQEDENSLLNLLNMFRTSSTTTTGSGTGTATPQTNPTEGIGTLLGQMYMQQQLNKDNAASNATKALNPAPISVPYYQNNPNAFGTLVKR